MRQGSVLQICTSSDFLQFTAPLLRRMAEDGIDVHALSSPGVELDALRQVPGITAHAITMARGIDPFEDARALPQVLKLMHELRPNLVHAHTPKAGLLAMIAATAAKVPVRLYQMHGLRYESASGVRRALLKNVERLSCSLAHQVICVSSSVRAVAVHDRIVSEAKAVVLGEGSIRGVDGEHFDPGIWRQAGRDLRKKWGIEPLAPCLGYAGRLNRDKGLGVLSQSFLELKKANQDAHLLLAGEEDKTDPVDLSKLRSHKDCHFLGQVSDLRAFYEACDVIVLPSYREGLPQVLLEAAAMKRPVVASEVTGVVDVVIPEETGLLVPAGDPHELTLALQRLLGCEELRIALGERAREEVVNRFRPEQVYQETLALYRQASRVFG